MASALPDEILNDGEPKFASQILEPPKLIITAEKSYKWSLEPLDRLLRCESTKVHEMFAETLWNAESSNDAIQGFKKLSERVEEFDGVGEA